MNNTALRPIWGQRFNIVLHSAFIVFGFYFLATGRLAEAASNWGISLAFDPFYAHTPWSERKWYMKAWLIAVLSAVLASFAYVLISTM
jgi:hypothetical protein